MRYVVLWSFPVMNCIQTSLSYVAVFISPAQLAEWKDLFADPKVKGKVALVAVDEAHCISEWLIVVVA